MGDEKKEREEERERERKREKKEARERERERVYKDCGTWSKTQAYCYCPHVGRV
jgi:hypothetical protein